MAHVKVEAAEAILDKTFPVLDNGFVRLVDYMGGDERVAQAARVSYGDAKKNIRDDKLLINYMMAHQHTSPFEHVVFEFHCKMPIFVARQWIRHRTARVNEISGRYSVLKDEFYLPQRDRIQFQSKSNRQGSSAETVPDVVKDYVLGKMLDDQKRAAENYHYILDDNIAKELARINLPLSTYTEWYWQMDLHNLFHFLELRLDSHAQWEIQQYGIAIAEIVKAVTPLSWDAFERNVLKQTRFSEDEMNAIRSLLNTGTHLLGGQQKIDFEQKLGLSTAVSKA